MLRTPTRRFTFVLATLTVTLGLTAATAMPATAAPDPLKGKGKAIVRIDAARATVTDLGEHRYRIALPSRSRGQWLGERKVASGKQKTLVGTLTATDLANRWADLGYRKNQRVGSTITWSSAGSSPSKVPAMLTRPLKNASGTVSFDVVAEADIPPILTNATINVSRASGPMARAFPVNATFWFADSLFAYSVITGVAGSARESLTSLASSIDCWDGTLDEDMFEIYMSEANQICDDFIAQGTWQIAAADPTGGQNGHVYFNGTIQPQGQAAMAYSATIATWGANG